MTKSPQTPEDVAAKIADDLRARWGLRRRGDHNNLRSNEIKIMDAQERDIDRLVSRRIRSLVKGLNNEH